MWERIGECWSCLDRWERKLSDVVRFVKSKDSLQLIVVDMLLHFDNIGVQFPDILDVRENECLLGIEAESYDVHDVCFAHLDRSLLSFQIQLRSIEVLLIVSNLDHNGYIEDTLQVLTEDERNTVTDVDSIA